MEKCNCGREIRYMTNIMEDGSFSPSHGSCNKHYKCRPYDEILEESDQRFRKLNELLIAAEGLTMFREGTTHYLECEAVVKRIKKELDNGLYENSGS